MEKFEVNENVVVKFDDGATASGKVIRELDNDTYLVFYFSKGMSEMKSGEFHSSQLTSFGTALFLATESYGAELDELEMLAD